MIVTSIDLGSSLTKSFYLDHGMPCPLVMEPEIASVQPELLDRYQSVNQDAYPEKVAWVQLDDEIAAVGQFAQNFAGDMGLVERKERRAIHKILAVLGSIQERLQLSERTAAILSVMLPVTEFSDRKKLQSSIQEAAASFTFRGKALSIEFQKLQILPEGFGLFLTLRAELIKQQINPRNRNILVLMLGHRNLSLLIFQNGVLQDTSRSDGPGFFNAVKIAASLQGLPEGTPHLTEAIAMNHASLRVAGQLMPINLKATNLAAREGYWKQVKTYLENHLPGGEYDVIVAGGAGTVIETELNTLFQQMDLPGRLSFGEGLKYQLQALLQDNPDLRSQPSLIARMADSYAVFGATWAAYQTTNAA